MKLPVVYGVTHSADTGALDVRVPRATKVVIGKPKDSGLHVFLAPSADKTRIVAVLEIGRQNRLEQRLFGLEDEQIKMLKRDYASLLTDETVVKRKSPAKLPYFSFMKEGGDGSYIHDIDCIIKHGVRPKEVEIIITDDEPLKAQYEFWTASKLNCFGNGRDGFRSVNFTPTKADEVAAEAAKKIGKKWFPIMDGCFTTGCPFASPVIKTKNGRTSEYKQCGLHGSLAFQMVNDIRLGAKAEFTTTGGKSVRQLLASLVELASFTGQGKPENGTVRGVPLILTVNQFKTNHNGQAGTAFAVRLEFRADSVGAIRDKLQDASRTFGGMLPTPAAKLAEPAPKQIAAGAEVAQIAAAAEEEQATEVEVIDAAYEESEPADDDDIEAAFRNRQFGSGDDGDEDGEPAQESPEVTFDEARAKLMAEAEAAESEQPQPADPDPAPPSSDKLFAESLGGNRYEDPGEQTPKKSRLSMNRANR
jgi:hypothetical protein